MSAAKIWSEFLPPFGWLEACFNFFGCSAWLLIVFMLELVEVVFLAWCLWLFKISSCCWVFVSVWFCCFVVLKAAAYVLLLLCWLLPLFSSWFGWLNFMQVSLAMQISLESLQLVIKFLSVVRFLHPAERISQSLISLILPMLPLWLRFYRFSEGSYSLKTPFLIRYCHRREW